MRHVFELLVPGFGHPILLCRGRMPQAKGIAAFVRDGYGAFRPHKFDCGCFEMMVVMALLPDVLLCVWTYGKHLDDQIYDYIATQIAAVQTEDVCVFFLFVAYFNGQLQGG